MAASDCAELIDFCLQNNPDIELGIEVKDEWYSLREVDYTVRMKVKDNPIVRTLDGLKSYEATKCCVLGQLITKSFTGSFPRK